MTEVVSSITINHLSFTISYFYLHIPFCRQKCPYCKFALTPVFDEFKKKRYIEYLKKEIKSSLRKELSEGNEDGGLVREDLQSPIPLPLSGIPLSQGGIKTIYFGGGTPSVLSLDEVRDILDCFPERSSDCEITFECNPEDITTEYVIGLLHLGINRISLGVQSLNNSTLSAIHRSDEQGILSALSGIESAILSSPRFALDKLGGTKDMLRQFQTEADSSEACPAKRDQNDKKSGISVNVDFILGLPHVERGETLENIKTLHKDYPFITHTSVYILEKGLYPKSWKSHTLDDSLIQDELMDILEYFESIGWDHYELSNWARPGYESRHNQAYWNHSNYRGFGLSAASYIDGKRWTNNESFTGYYKGLRIGEELLTPEQIAIEELMFGLRTTEGCDLSNPYLSVNTMRLQEFVSQGLITHKKKIIKLTKTGIFVIDYIIGELIS